MAGGHHGPRPTRPPSTAVNPPVVRVESTTKGAQPATYGLSADEHSRGVPLNPTGIVIESQLDWLTCAVHTERGAEELEHYARMLARTGEGKDERETPFRLKGYQGWQVGRVRFGSRPGAALIQLSGDAAATHFDDLAPVADSISRVDIAVTARLSQTDNDLGLRSYLNAQGWYLNHNNAARPSFHGDADGGYTCYVGERTSDWFLRVYNKAVETRLDPDQAEHYRDCWRYELECKGGTTGNLVAELAAHEGDARAAAIQDMVWEYVHRHGMVPAFPKAGSVALVPGFRRRSDRASKLNWLARSVAPAVTWLAETGDAAEIYEALGLSIHTADGRGTVDPTTGAISYGPT